MSERSHDTWASEPAHPAHQLDQIMYSDSMWYHRGNGGVPAYSAPEEDQLSLHELRNAFGVHSTVTRYDEGLLSRLAGPAPGGEPPRGKERRPPPPLNSRQGAPLTQGHDYSDANAYHEPAEALQYARAQFGPPEYAKRTEHDQQLIQRIPLNFTDTRRIRPVADSGPAWGQSPETLRSMQDTPLKVAASSASTDRAAYQVPVKKESNATIASASSSVTMAAASSQSSKRILPESVKGAQWTHFRSEDRSIATEQYLPILTMSQEAEHPEPAEPEEEIIRFGRHLSRKGTARHRRDVGTIPRQVISDAIGPMSKTERALHDLDAWDGCPNDERGSQ